MPKQRPLLEETRVSMGAMEASMDVCAQPKRFILTVHFVNTPGIFCLFLAKTERDYERLLFHPDSLNLLPRNLDLDAVWRTQVRPLHDRPADPDVSR
jgi:hypothetical protein